jgi:hypothetical protein
MELTMFVRIFIYLAPPVDTCADLYA